MKKGLAGPICGILAIASMFFLIFSISALTVVPAAGSPSPGRLRENQKGEDSRIGR